MKLVNVDLLATLDGPEYSTLRKSFVERSYTRGAIIFSPLEEADRVFIVKSGRVRIFLASDVKEFTLAILERGDIYSTHTRAYVAALDDSLLWVMDTAGFHKSLADHPNLAGAMINVLGGLLKNSMSIISGLVFNDVNRRLVEYLLAEARASDERHDDGILVRLDLTTEQVAQIVGSTRQTVSVLINDLVRAGDIEKVERGVFLVPDTGRLEARLS